MYCNLISFSHDMLHNIPLSYTASQTIILHSRHIVVLGQSSDEDVRDKYLWLLYGEKRHAILHSFIIPVATLRSGELLFLDRPTTGTIF